MKTFGHLIEWEQIDLRISGHKLQEKADEQLRRKQLPVSDLKLEFQDGAIIVTTKIQKGIAIPVRCTVVGIRAIGSRIEVQIGNVSTFGVLPVPKALFAFVGELKLPKGVRFDAETMRVVIGLEQLLPSFVDVTVEAVQMIAGGLVVRLGSGGADVQGV